MDKKMKDIIKDIAGELDCGLDCYYSPKTKEVIGIPTEDALMDFDDDDEILKKVESNKADFIKIKALESFESFKIMEGFRDEVPDEHLTRQLTAALNNRKPFQNFKYLVDNSEYRQKWFDFKQEALEQHVREQLKLN